MRLVFRLLVVVCGTLAGVAAGLAQGEKRVALVIGNSAYQHTRVLPNPRNDAEAIAKLLRANGFVDVTLKHDLDYRAMREAMRLFGEAARGADIALFYYGGHGIEVAGENYLIPTDAKLLRDTDLEYEAVTLASVLGVVGRAKRLRVAILDACRNNPLGESMTLSAGIMRSVTRGLARIEPKGDVLVAYSARAGTLAQDGVGRHSPYAEALLKHMMTPGLDVRLMFGKVRDQVLAATRQQQEPYIYGSLSGDVIPLVPGLVAPPHPVTRQDRFEEARQAFQDAKGSQQRLAAVAEHYKDTIYGEYARQEIQAMLKAEQERNRAEEATKQAAEAAKKKADEEARAKAETERQRLALLQQDEQRKRIEAATARQAAEAAKKKADDDARLEAAAAKKQAEGEARAKRATEEAAERKRLKQEEERKQGAEETKIAALPKIEKPAGSGSFAGSWTITWHGPKCTPSSGSYSIRIEGDFIHLGALTPSGRVRWSQRIVQFARSRTGHFSGGLRGNSGSGQFRVGSNPACKGTWTARRN